MRLRLADGLILLAAHSLSWASGPALPLEVGSWIPYIDFSKTDRGLLSAVVQDAFRQAGVATTLREVSWKTAQDHIDKAGAVSFGWIRTEAREARWHYSLPICTTRTVLITRQDRPLAWTRLEQLKDIRLGWSRGYSY
ncbi:MAG: hypothetical protein ACOVLH_00950, partial [Roseateles sp.]